MKQVVYLFPGQGSQKVGMGRSFYDALPEVREYFEEASDRLKVDMAQLLFEPNELLDRTPYTQPAILLVSSIAHLLFQKGSSLQPLAALGHSLGEFTALVSVGALDMGDGVELVHRRGALMEEGAKGVDGGMMVVLGLEDRVVEEICQKAREEGLQVWPANYNSEGQIVVAGIKEDLMATESRFKEAGAKRALLLNMSVASHCPLMADASRKLGELVERFLRDSFTAPVISNVTASPYQTKEEGVQLLPKQLVQPVLYKHSIKAVEDRTDLFIEFGEGKVLTGLNRRITKVPTIAVHDMESLERALKEVA
ncbi:MAG: ACP S-malonyltransferase [Epsilonproteobacteria bacterium]|nr:[acyl-carrier-protein] S-malonyltransferase [Campylobacterota bacterium]NPA56686.1 ACP S-malonyltransferase [Campylobacterota bacterium]